MPYDVFISYRRSDAAAEARQITTSLEKEGYRVFLDYDGIPDGKFDARIYSAIDEAPVFVIILTEGYLERCCEEANWVRWEVEYAIRTRRKIVPLFFDTCPDIPEGIPKEIKDNIGSYQFSKIDTTQLYKDSVTKLIRDRIAPVIVMKQDAENGSGAEIHIETDADCQVQRFHHELITAYAGKENTIWLKEGRHKLQFVSTEDDSVAFSKVYTVENVLKSDYIEVELLSDLQKKRIERKFAGHDYVDLGLPSGTLWATCNVGASKPSDYGSYFAWGETESKKKSGGYYWKNLKYRIEGDTDETLRFSKYVAEAKYVDNRTILEPSDDAAHVQWGGAWRMPTHEEWVELYENCDWEWTKQDGRNGYKVTSRKNGASIFLPAAGWCGGESRSDGGVIGNYWSSSLYSDYSYVAFLCFFNSDVVGPSYWDSRYYGFSVRPVASSLQ